MGQGDPRGSPQGGVKFSTHGIVMKFHRRKFLHLAAGAATLPALWRSAQAQAQAQAYPTHPVRLVVGFAAGSTTDILARLMAQWLSQRLGQQFVVENRPGAGGNVGAEVVVRSQPDGYTLLMVPPAVAANAALYHLNFDFVRDTAPIAGVVRVPNIAEVHPSLPVKSIPELIAYAKANPGKLSYASAGIGTPSHLAGQLFNIMARVNIQHVPYRGDGPAMADLIAGQVPLAFATVVASIEHIRAGQLRPLAVTTLKRSDALPELPSVSEFVPGYETSSWFGIAAPAGTPAEIIARLNGEINAGLADSVVKTRLADMGCMLLAGSPADFGRLIADETEKWGTVIREAGIKAD
jgi:tripartite-type tricarboxylate transporter receptor subunit TctC